MIAAIMPQVAFAVNGTMAGYGTATDPYLIEDASDLKAFRDLVNNGDSDIYGELTADIVLNPGTFDENGNYTPAGGETAEAWEPIAHNESNAFLGVLDGKGFKISGLYINTSDSYQGLFGKIGAEGTIKNLIIENSYINASSYVGAFSGYNDGGTIVDCLNSGCDIYASKNVGGITGFSNGGSIMRCDNSANITYDSYVTDAYIGGIAGRTRNGALVQDCRNTGTISLSNAEYSYVGGIVGYNDAKIVSCVNEGEVSASNYETGIGGIAGVNNDLISGCGNSAPIIGEEQTYAGGIAGCSWSEAAEIDNCYNTGAITNEDYMAGGIMGWMYAGSIKNCYNTGDITGDYNGGVIGYNEVGTAQNTFFLRGTASYASYGSDETIEAEKIYETEFNEGGIAYLLQAKQEEDDTGNISQVWGQNLIGTDIDAYPVLSSESAKAVCKVTFIADGTEFAAKYTNPNGTVTLPENDPPAKDGKGFGYWTTSTESSFPDDEKVDEFTAETTVLGDTKVYSVYGRQFQQTAGSASVYAVSGYSATIDLNDYVEFVNNDISKYGQFKFELNGTLPEGVTFDGNSTVTWSPSADTQQPVTASFTVTDVAPYLSLMSMDPDPAVQSAVLTITFAVTEDLSTYGFERDTSDTSGNTYYIRDLDDMNRLQTYVNGGNGAEGMTFIMTNDIDLGGEEKPWTPIGTAANQFKGTFDGKGVKISGLYINTSDSYQGLFGVVSAEGTVKNVGVSGTVSATDYVSGVVGVNMGTTENCYSTCAITSSASSYVGGITGYNAGTIEKCYNTGDIFVYSDGSKSKYVGGIAGVDVKAAVIRSCYNTGDVRSDEFAGGVVGGLQGTLENCYNTGTISTTTDNRLGGVVGNFISGYSMSNCFYLTDSAEGAHNTGGTEIDAQFFADQSKFTDWDFDNVWQIDEWFERPVLRNPREDGGSGTAEDPYKIPDLETLERFRDAVNNGNNYEGKYIILTNDIEINPGTFDEDGNYTPSDGETAKEWEPIALDESNPFLGVLDGNGHTIRGLYINSPDADYQGLFGYLGDDTTEGTEVKNIGIVNSFIKGKDAVGNLVGISYGTISNIYTSGTVTGSGIAGGIAGSNIGTVRNSYSECTAVGSDAGSIVGGNTGTVQNCYYNSDIYTGTGTVSGVTGKTVAELASGEVTHLLQGAQQEQIWGQTIRGERTDLVPVLSNDNTKKVLKISFIVNSNEFATRYTNFNGTVSIPEKPTDETYEFVKWSQENSVDGDEFNESTAVTSDMTVYAICSEMFGTTDNEKIINAVYGEGVKQDLSEYMAYSAGTEAAGKFSYEIIDGNKDTATANGNTVAAVIDNDMLIIPDDTNADTYTLDIKVSEKQPEFSLMSIDWGIDPVEFTVTVTINKKTLTMSNFTFTPPSDLIYDGSEKTAAVTVNDGIEGTEAITVKYYDINGTQLDSAPVDVGTYTVCIDVAGNNNYADVTDMTDSTWIFEVEQAIPVLAEDTKVTAQRVRRGNSLSTSEITGTVNGLEGQPIDGTWTWKTDREMDEAGTFEETAVFTPTDTNYAPFETVVSVTVYRPSSGGGLVTRYTVTFDTQGGSKVSSKTVNWNAIVSEPAAPTRDGYIFEGWFTDEDCTTEYDFDTKVTKNITLYAKWTEEPTETTEPADWENPYEDVNKNDWFYDNVRYAEENGLFSGITSTTFEPNTAITRGMLVTVLWRAEEKPVVNYLMTFADVDEGEYYSEAVRWAASEQIVKGYSEEEFAPNKLITREEMAAIINRYADYKGIETVQTGDLTQFSDRAQISDWATENVSWAVGNGILSGKGEGILDPNGNTTRAETAAILQRILEK